MACLVSLSFGRFWRHSDARNREDVAMFFGVVLDPDWLRLPLPRKVMVRARLRLRAFRVPHLRGVGPPELSRISLGMPFR